MKGYPFFLAQATTFLYSMATLNLPDWRYGLCYKYDLVNNGLQRRARKKVADDWLEAGCTMSVLTKMLNCRATKTVLQLEEDQYMYEIVCSGQHTCMQLPNEQDL